MPRFEYDANFVVKIRSWMAIVHNEITLVDALPRPLAVVRVTTVLSRWPGEFMKALDKVYAAVKAGKLEQNGHNVMVYRPRADGLVDIECGIDVSTRFEGLGEVVYSETPAGPAAKTAHIGPYQQLGMSHKAIAEWCRENGHSLTGTCWEIYGDWEQDPAKLRTDLFHLLEKS
jgi:effector-binding domain-containing protein